MKVEAVSLELDDSVIPRGVYMGVGVVDTPVVEGRER
jgi:hypothetical protein